LPSHDQPLTVEPHAVRLTSQANGAESPAVGAEEGKPAVRAEGGDAVAVDGHHRQSVGT
jgi:hypothetical protein